MAVVLMVACTDKNEPSNESANNTYTEQGGGNNGSNGSNSGSSGGSFTLDEMLYLFYTRDNAANLRGQAKVCGVYCVLYLPDDWVLPEGLSFTPSPNNFTSNVYDADDWAKMEANGAVCLPSAGNRDGTNVSGVGQWGSYWTGSYGGIYGARYISFNSSDDTGYDGSNRNDGYSVRLVRNAQ